VKKSVWIPLVVMVCLVFVNRMVYGQSGCTADVPFYVVDLSSDPEGSWTSPLVSRSGECCSGASTNCVEFLVSLHPLASGVVLEIISGSMPSGSLFYQNSCSTPTNVGDSMCLTGTGPHSLIFCKPGSNANIYRLTSFGRPSAGDDITISSDCSFPLGVTGFKESSIVWKSIYPGVEGAYNSLLSCTLGCSSPVLTPSGVLPAYVDYQVSGSPQTTCAVNLADTVRVYFVPGLNLSISPQNPSVCYDSVTVFLTATVTGGAPPYNYQWDSGETTVSINANTGSYSCLVTDQSVCPGISDTVQVLTNPLPISADAGTDQFICHDDSLVFLSGSVEMASGGIWSGGAGVFDPDNHSLSVQYHFTDFEKTLSSVTLILTTIGNGNCPTATDSIQITRYAKPLTSDIQHY